jgi:hypothetical protein
LAELEGMPRSSASPTGFGVVNFPLPGTRGKAFLPEFEFFHGFPSKGGNGGISADALLIREMFRDMAAFFKKAKILQYL